jgi:hypothetical protein
MVLKKKKKGNMKTLLYILFLSIFITFAAAPIVKKSPEVISIFGYVKHVDVNGNPSRNDEEYHECSLYLYTDKTFMMIDQTGQLTPKYETKTGTWDIANEELVLQIKQMKSTKYSVLNKKNDENFSPMSGAVAFKKILKQNLSDGANIWEYMQGMRPDEIFSKCVNVDDRTVKSPEFDPKTFAAKLNFSIKLINKQPVREDISKMLPEGFTIESFGEFEYSFKYMENDIVNAYLDHLYVNRIVYVEFFDKKENLKDANSFISKNYNFFASEENCLYFTDKKISIVVIPMLQERTTIHVSKYDL